MDVSIEVIQGGLVCFFRYVHTGDVGADAVPGQVSLHVGRRDSGRAAHVDDVYPSIVLPELVVYVARDPEGRVSAPPCPRARPVPHAPRGGPGFINPSFVSGRGKNLSVPS